MIIHLPVNHHAFADPFQISGLNLINNNIEFLAYGKPDLEVDVSVKEKALMNGVFVVVKNVTQFFEDGSNIVEIPLHMRYQTPSEEGTGYVVVPVYPVNIFAVLPVESQHAHQTSTHILLNHLMKLIDSKTGSRSSLGKQSIVQLPVVHNGTMSMKIPVGNKMDQDWVLWTLSTSVVASCLYIMVAFVVKFK
ncbi:UNVERIFIED_CONTAM: hypothetical protein HDU68_011518 [Siphonaria sp. JEL0065]|nr:hypothetical protein HDU68_011518 [Siphonaria sp. JEL0065]